MPPRGSHKPGHSTRRIEGITHNAEHTPAGMAACEATFAEPPPLFVGANGPKSFQRLATFTYHARVAGRRASTRKLKREHEISTPPIAKPSPSIDDIYQLLLEISVERILIAYVYHLYLLPSAHKKYHFY